MSTLALELDSPDEPRAITVNRNAGDRRFRGVARGSGTTVLIVVTLVGLFLSLRAFEALRVAGFGFITTAAWEPNSGNFGVAAVLTGTIMIALVALVVSLPLALGTALYISEYAPRGLKKALRSVVDLAAAVPSIVYGLWGAYFLKEYIDGLARWLATYMNWIPFLRVEGADPRDPLTSPTFYQSSTFIAGVVVGLMVTPIASSVMREVFTAAPAGEREAALALGSTRWGMIRTVVLPYGRGGIIGGTMLGLGRALGETIAIYLIINPVFDIKFRILENGSNSVAAHIALRYTESTG
ncbi:MAG: phosphate ABC transporter permease subunit PstC, partial [Mycobacteriales bacterium]